MTELQSIIYEEIDRAAWITLNRPQSRNALSASLVNELYQSIQAANKDENIRCIVITGNGSSFCSGADLKSPPGQTIAGVKSISFADVLKAIQESVKPVISCINGSAFAGGLGLIGASDIAIASDSAVFSFSEVRIGVIPAVISVVCLPKLGLQNGMKLFLTGEKFTGEAAVTLGLVNRAVDHSELRDAVCEEIKAIALGGPNAIMETKKLVHQMCNINSEEAFEIATEWSARMFQSEEGGEGINAFREKRKPNWQ